MSSYEFVEWMAFLNMEAHERERTEKEMEAKVKAAQQDRMLGR